MYVTMDMDMDICICLVFVCVRSVVVCACAYMCASLCVYAYVCVCYLCMHVFPPRIPRDLTPPSRTNHNTSTIRKLPKSSLILSPIRGEGVQDP